MFALIRIAYPDRYLYHFEALKQDFRQYNVTIDKQCGDVTRLRFYSYDENAYFNHSAQWYNKVVYPQKPIHRMALSHAMNKNHTAEKVVRLIQKITKNSIDITTDYGTWFKLGCAFACEFGESGRELYHQISMYHSEYNPTQTDRQYTHCLKHAH